MAEAGLAPADELSIDLTVADGRRAVRDLLRRGRLPGALVCASDEVAIGALHELRLAGVDVPGQVSVVGVDDHPHAELHDLTTIAQPVAEQAELATRWVLDSLEGADGRARRRRPRPTCERLPTRLVLRGSTGPAGELTRAATGRRRRTTGRPAVVTLGVSAPTTRAPFVPVLVRPLPDRYGRVTPRPCKCMVQAFTCS